MATSFWSARNLHPHFAQGAEDGDLDGGRRHLDVVVVQLFDDLQKNCHKIFIILLFHTLAQMHTYGIYQISAKCGTDSKFVLEANLKSLYPSLSRSSILKTQNRNQSKHDYKPGSKSFKYVTKLPWNLLSIIVQIRHSTSVWNSPFNHSCSQINRLTCLRVKLFIGLVVNLRNIWCSVH